MLVGCNEAASIFFVTKSSRNDPETVSAPPHRVLLSPYRDSHYDARMSAPHGPMGSGGVKRIEYEYGSVVLRFAGRFVLSRWRCVRRQWSRRVSGFGKVSPRRSGRHRIMRASRRRIVRRRASLSCIVAITGTSRAHRAGSAAWRRCRRAALPTPRPAVDRTPRRRHGRIRAASAHPSIVAEARRYIGGNPTGRGSLWCARFMNMVLQRSGHRGTGSDMASSFASYGQRVSGPQVGAIAVMGAARRRPCRHHQRHRRPGQSDHDLGQ